MRVLLAAFCFTATEPPGFGSTERMMCVPVPCLSLHRQHVNLPGGGALCAFACMFVNTRFCATCSRCAHDLRCAHECCILMLQTVIIFVIHLNQLMQKKSQDCEKCTLEGNNFRSFKMSKNWNINLQWYKPNSHTWVDWARKYLAFFLGLSSVIKVANDRLIDLSAWFQCKCRV